MTDLIEPVDQRFAMARRVQVAQDVTMPEIPLWNDRPCGEHQELDPLCRRCGIEFRRHQRVGITWLYLMGKALLADTVGSGKTIHGLGLLSLLASRGELERAVVICRPAALFQWRNEAARAAPGLRVSVADGSRAKRQRVYLENWNVMLIGHQMFLRDIEIWRRIEPDTVIIDDVDALRHRETQTAWAIKSIAVDAPRVVIMSGTPLQKRLHELHSVLETIGLRSVLGSEAVFRRRYVREELVTYWTGRGRKITTTKVVGYKNLEEFKALIGPYVLRREARDLDDVTLPTVMPSNHWLELSKAQRERYKDLQKGVLELKAKSKIKQVEAAAKLMYGARICTGLAALGEEDRVGEACKLDWLMELLVEGDLSEEKVVVFGAFKDTLRALQARLDGAGVGHVTIWADESSKALRQERIERFWTEPACRVLMGTQAIEQSLNLQVARHIVNLDMVMNPARMEQLAGRIRRDGSAHSHVFVHNVLTVDTQEERYLPVLESEQALLDYVWEEDSPLFESLSPLRLLTLIAP